MSWTPNRKNNNGINIFFFKDNCQKSQNNVAYGSDYKIKLLQNILETSIKQESVQNTQNMQRTLDENTIMPFIYSVTDHVFFGHVFCVNLRESMAAVCGVEIT